jgi:hypothetical protein
MKVFQMGEDFFRRRLDVDFALDAENVGLGGGKNQDNDDDGCDDVENIQHAGLLGLEAIGLAPVGADLRRSLLATPDMADTPSGKGLPII